MSLDYDKIKDEYIANDGILASPSLNSTLLNVLRERFCSKIYENKSQLFPDSYEINNAFTQILITRSNYSKQICLPLGLRSLKSNPYLLYLLNFHQQQTSFTKLTEQEIYLSEMLFPNWDFFVYAEGDEYVHMVLLPKSERDLFLLNTDLTSLMHDLIGKYSMNHCDNGLPIYDDCRHIVDGLIEQVEGEVGVESQYLSKDTGQTKKKLLEEQFSSLFLRKQIFQKRNSFFQVDHLDRVVNVVIHLPQLIFSRRIIVLHQHHRHHHLRFQ